MRVRIFASASVCSGSAASLTSIVTSAAPVPPGRPVTCLTLPISTPAMRTGDLGLSPTAFSNTAVTVGGEANGFVFVKPK